MCGDTQIEAGNLRKRMRHMRKKNESGKTGFDWQFSVSRENVALQGTITWNRRRCLGRKSAQT